MIEHPDIDRSNWEVELGIDLDDLRDEEREAEWAREKRREDERRAVQTRELTVLVAYINEARAGTKRGSVEYRRIHAQALERYQRGDGCIWCSLDPVRAKSTMLCQRCAVYRRKYDRLPSHELIEKRRDKIPPG